MEALVVGGVLDRLEAAVGQQNVVLASGHAVRVPVLGMAEVVSGMVVAHPIAERVAGSVLVQLLSAMRRELNGLLFIYWKFNWVGAHNNRWYMNIDNYVK